MTVAFFSLWRKQLKPVVKQLSCMLSNSSKTQQKSVKDNLCENGCKTKIVPGKSFAVEAKVRALAWMYHVHSSTNGPLNLIGAEAEFRFKIPSPNTIPKRKVGSDRKSTVSPMDLRVLKRYVCTPGPHPACRQDQA